MVVSNIFIQSKIKSETDRLVLKTIYDAGKISRAAIARATRLTRPTISTAVGKLLDEGLVAELGQVTNGRGKPATLIEVVDNSCCVIGIDISNREFQGEIFDVRGRPIISQSRFVNYDDPASIFPALLDLIDDLIQEVQVLGIPLLGIGIGSPGLLNVKDGSIQFAVNLGWHNFPLRQKIEARYQVPVYVFNDSQAAALGQFTFDNPDGAQNLIVLKVGRGISAGIILDGKIYSGSHFGASEIGHLQIVEDGELCQCGNRGCLETVASSLAIVRQVSQLQQQGLPNQPNELTTEDVLAAFERGNKEIEAIIVRAGKYIGIAVASLVGILNISDIVIAGSLSRFGSTLLNAIQDEMEKRVLGNLVAQTNLKLSNLGQDIVMKGAASVILHHELGVI